MIGVVIPHRNKQELLAKCLHSLSLQAQVGLDVVVVDDIDPDLGDPRSLTLISDLPEFQRGSFRRLRVFRRSVKTQLEGKGNWLQCCRNYGLCRLDSSLQREDFVLFCDADVVWHPGALFQMQEALRKAPSDVAYVYCDYRRDGALREDWVAGPFSAERLRHDNFISTMSLIRPACLPDVPWDEDIERMQDWALWLKLLNLGYRGIYLPQQLFTAYYEPDSISLRGQPHCDYWKRVVHNRYNMRNWQSKKDIERDFGVRLSPEEYRAQLQQAPPPVRK